MITKAVNLWLGNGPRVVIPVSQFDTMWQFTFAIVKDGLTWEIPSGASAVLNGLKPDGNVFAFSGTISGNTVTVDCDVQMTAVAGDTICELSILADGKTVGTANFTLAVEAAPKSPDDVSSESTIPVYEELMELFSGDIADGVAAWLDEHPEAVVGGHAWNSTDIYYLQQVLEVLRYSSASASTIVDDLLSALAETVDKGWTTYEIDLLDDLLDLVEFTDPSGGDLADTLIASLRGALPSYEDADTEEF